ncbi:MAG: hypothetical protein H6Q20_444 [Bacteroidetes bacterium]|nr:hypothetical protein [Bacteroidota bacterium]
MHKNTKNKFDFVSLMPRILIFLILISRFFSDYKLEGLFFFALLSDF